MFFGVLSGFICFFGGWVFFNVVLLMLGVWLGGFLFSGEFVMFVFDSCWCGREGGVRL